MTNTEGDMWREIQIENKRENILLILSQVQLQGAVATLSSVILTEMYYPTEDKPSA